MRVCPHSALTPMTSWVTGERTRATSADKFTAVCMKRSSARKTAELFAPSVISNLLGISQSIGGIDAERPPGRTQGREHAGGEHHERRHGQPGQVGRDVVGRPAARSPNAHNPHE